jgi:hypothetical protein
MARTRSSGSKTPGTASKQPKRANTRSRKKAAPKGASGSLDDEVESEGEDEDLPKDEAGRLKIKRQYEELLGIRIEKLKGRILNRERINKTIEGIYFICATCKKICHNLDEGLVEDPNNANNLCNACGNVKEPRGGRRKKAATV